MEENRKSKRVVRPLNIKFCLSDENPRQWNLSPIIGNISIGGVKFIAPNDLKDKTLFLEIKSPRITPRVLLLQALVLDSSSSEHPSYFDIRAKFVNLSPSDLSDLSILEKE